MNNELHRIAVMQELYDALQVMTDHAEEKWPHFESERGQRDIAAAKAAMDKAKEVL